MCKYARTQKNIFLMYFFSGKKWLMLQQMRSDLEMVKKTAWNQITSSYITQAPQNIRDKAGLKKQK